MPTPLEHAAAASLRVAPVGSVGLRSQWGWSDHAVRQGRWECLHAARDGLCVAFDQRGNLLAIGTAAGTVSRQHGSCKCRCRRRTVAQTGHHIHCLPAPPMLRLQVLVWDVGAVRLLSATLTVPALLPGPRSISAVAWSANSRLLFGAAAAAGLVHVWDVARGRLLRSFALPGVLDGAPVPGGGAASSASGSPLPPSLTIRSLKPHPVDYGLLLVVTAAGLPWLADWRTGEAWRVRGDAAAVVVVAPVRSAYERHLPRESLRVTIQRLGAGPVQLTPHSTHRAAAAPVSPSGLGLFSRLLYLRALH
jgi:WD40 repeat protein